MAALRDVALERWGTVLVLSALPGAFLAVPPGDLLAPEETVLQRVGGSAARAEQRAVRARAAVGRGLLLGLLWWVLTEGDPPGWYYGAAATTAALVLSLRLSPPRRGEGGTSRGPGTRCD